MLNLNIVIKLMYIVHKISKEAARVIVENAFLQKHAGNARG